MRLYHNMASINAFKSYSKSLDKQSSVMNRINTGSRVNKSKENPNGVGKCEVMRIQIKGLQMAQQNLQDGVSLMQTIDGDLSSINEYMNRLKELVVKAGGVNNADDRQAIQNEIEEMSNGINQVAFGSEFNGVHLIGDKDVIDNNDPKLRKMLAGANSGDTLKIPFYNLGAEKLNLTKIDVVNGDIGDMIQVVDNASDIVNSVRTKYGGICNRLESSYDVIGETSMTIEKAQSSIGDADIALEMVDLAKYNLLVESSIAIMGQTNNFPKDVLRILDNLK